MTTLAEAFVAASPEDAIKLGAGGAWMECQPDSAEITFGDGSVASCRDGGPWEAIAMAERPGAPSRAEQNGVDPLLWDHGAQVEAERAILAGWAAAAGIADRVPRGWDCIEGGDEA